MGRGLHEPESLIFTLHDPSASYRFGYSGKYFRGNQLLDGSISLSPLYKNSAKRFARQHMCELPPEFPLASPSSGIVHHLSGPTARAFSSERGSVRLAFRFRFADGLVPTDSRERWTPWSVFQDGSLATKSPKDARRRRGKNFPRCTTRGRTDTRPRRRRKRFRMRGFGYFSLSFQSPFQLSLTVLLRYRIPARV